MNLKNKLILLSFILGSFTNLYSYTENDFNSYVTGSDVKKDVAGNITIEEQNHGTNNGNTEIKKGIGAFNGATVEVWESGKITSGKQTYNSEFGGVLGGGVSNRLEKTDTLIWLESRSTNDSPITTLINNGEITSGSVRHELEVILEIAPIGKHSFANYTKNTITSKYSHIINNKTISSQGDEFYLASYVAVSALSKKVATYNKNVINATGGKIINNEKGRIELGRDFQPEFLDGINVGLLSGGFEYGRNVSAIAGANTTIENSGVIFTGGDIYKGSNFSGIDLNLLGADFKGVHNKYGIKGSALNITNTGTIEVEKDFAKGWDETTEGVVDITIVGEGELLGLSLLSFNNMKEKSVGVSISDGSIFNNVGGTLKVGANQDKGGILISSSGAIAVEANNSSANFSGNSNIELTGTNVYLSNLSNGATMTFDGITTVDYMTKDSTGKVSDKVNTALFNNDTNSKHIVKGKLKVNGGLTIDKGDNVEFSGNGDIESDNKLGLIHTEGTLTLNGDLKLSGDYLVGLSDKELSSLNGVEVVKSEGGITGNGSLISGSYLFNVDSNLNNGQKNNSYDSITVGEVKRQNFTNIVDNGELGNILEEMYNSSNPLQLEYYRILAQAETKEEFNNTLKAATGERNINNLSTQVYDITTDLNKEFKYLVRNTNSDTINFKYLNSESSMGNTNLADGFDRESNGIMFNLNKVNLDKKYGLGFAYLKSDISYTSNASKNDVTSWNIRGYRSKDFGAFNLMTDLSFGYNQSENTRTTAQDVLNGEVDLFTLGLNNSIWRTFEVNDKFTFTPSLNLDITYVSQDEYTEKGSKVNGNAVESISLQDTSSLFVRGGVSFDGEYRVATFDNSHLNLIGNLQYSYDFIDQADDLKEKVDVLGNDYFTVKSRELDQNSLAFEIGFKYEYNDLYSTSFTYSKELVNDVENDKFSFNIGYKL